MKAVKICLISFGFNYPCLAGAIMRINEAGYIISDVAGAGEGSIVASLLASGYKPNEELVRVISVISESQKQIYKKTFLNQRKLVLKDLEAKLQSVLIPSVKDLKANLRLLTYDLNSNSFLVLDNNTEPASCADICLAAASFSPIFRPRKIQNALCSGSSLREQDIENYFASDYLYIKTATDNISLKTALFGETNSDKEFLAKLSLANTDKASNKNITIVSSHNPCEWVYSDETFKKMIQEGWEAADRYLKRK